MLKNIVKKFINTGLFHLVFFIYWKRIKWGLPGFNLLLLQISIIGKIVEINLLFVKKDVSKNIIAKTLIFFTVYHIIINVIVYWSALS